MKSPGKNPDCPGVPLSIYQVDIVITWMRGLPDSGVHLNPRVVKGLAVSLEYF